MKFLSYLLEEFEHERRHRIAQYNAALPIEQGGLGLHKDNTSIDRAKAMGYDTDNKWYHSSLHSDTTSFKKSGSFMGYSGMTGIHLTDNKEMASRYLDRYGEIDHKYQHFNKNVIPVYVKVESTKEYHTPINSGIPFGSIIPKGFVSDYERKGHDSALLHDSISKRGSVRHVDDDAKSKISGYELIMNKPHHIRSINAAFDPLQKHSSDILS